MTKINVDLPLYPVGGKPYEVTASMLSSQIKAVHPLRIDLLSRKQEALTLEYNLGAGRTEPGLIEMRQQMRRQTAEAGQLVKLSRDLFDRLGVTPRKAC